MNVSTFVPSLIHTHTHTHTHCAWQEEKWTHKMTNTCTCVLLLHNVWSINTLYLSNFTIFMRCVLIEVKLGVTKNSHYYKNHTCTVTHYNTMNMCIAYHTIVLLVVRLKSLSTLAGWMYLPSVVRGLGCRKGQISAEVSSSFIYIMSTSYH